MDSGEGYNTLKKSHYLWGSVFVEILVAGCWLDVVFFHVVRVQKRGVVSLQAIASTMRMFWSP